MKKKRALVWLAQQPVKAVGVTSLFLNQDIKNVSSFKKLYLVFISLELDAWLSCVSPGVSNFIYKGMEWKQVSFPIKQEP